MKRLPKKQILRLLLVAILAAGIGIAFWHFVTGNEQRIRLQNEEYLKEFTLQRAASVNSLMEENLSFIQSTAYLYGESLTSPFANVAVIRRYEENAAFDMLRFIDSSGDNYTSKGVRSNLADRAYFQSGMQGESGVTFVAQSRVTGERQIGFYAPVYYGEQIIGVMVGFYGEDFIRNMLEYELFGYEGEGWLCASDGTVLGTTAAEVPENYLAWLEGNRISQGELSRIRTAFAEGENCSFSYAQGQESTAAHSAALKDNGWILIRTFPASASAQILGNANREGSTLLTTLLLLFAAFAAANVAITAVDFRRTREANRKANDISNGVSRIFDKFAELQLTTGQWRYLDAAPDDPQLPVSGAYALFCESLLARVPEEAQRAEIREFLRAENLKEALQDADVASMRVHAPLGEADRWYTYNFIVIERAQGAPVRLLVVRQDATALWRREEEARLRLEKALSDAESASRAKTEFLFNMSHDLRTPMNAIIGYTELALRDGVSAEDMKEYFTKVDSSGKHLLSLINDILEMSRVESGKMTLEPVATDLRKVLRETRELFAAQMREKKIDFRIIEDVTDHWVYCDAKRLDRVILNLISNAYKFTPEGGRVDVQLQQTARTETEAVYMLRVSDTGIGMSPSFVEKLFYPFERERTSTVSGIQGTGLGLSITKKIVDLMGGSITVETQQGQGTTFLVRMQLPVCAPETEEAPATAVPEKTEKEFDGIRVLLTEDNEINREIAQLILQEEGFIVETAENGQIAVEKIQEAEPGRYALILMDVQMPVMDGYTATRTIRALEDPARAGTPILAMTANAFAEDIQAAKEAGMDGHIAKPLDVHKMLEEIRAALRRSRAGTA